MTNMKWTLAHAPAALHALLEWYPLHDQVVSFLGERRATLFCHAISTETDCLICSTFFRRILIDAGEDPDALGLDEHDELVIAFGLRLAHDPHAVDDELFARLADRYYERADRRAHRLRSDHAGDERLQRRSPRSARRLPRAVSRAMSGRPVALVTGAAHGQGRATSLALAREGYDIVALDVAAPLAYPGYAMGTSDELETLRNACEELGAVCLAIVADVRDDPAVSAAVEAAVERFARIDVLFNNAGICAYGLAHELTEDAWDTMLDINLKGPWLVARRVIPHMIDARRGVIVNNSSIAGLRGMGRLSHYAASKWGLTGLTKSWAIELAPHGIRVVAIHPTGVDTPLNDGLAELEGTTALEIAERSAGNLLPVPWIEPEDVAEAVVYLVSDRARFITGSSLVLDAGLLTR